MDSTQEQNYSSASKSRKRVKKSARTAQVRRHLAASSPPKFISSWMRKAIRWTLLRGARLHDVTLASKLLRRRDSYHVIDSESHDAAATIELPGTHHATALIPPRACRNEER